MVGARRNLSDFIQNVLLIGGVILVAILCAASLKTSTKLRRWRATKLADDLDMELLASDNPNTLLVAGEINNRPSSIRYNKEKT